MSNLELQIVDVCSKRKKKALSLHQELSSYFCVCLLLEWNVSNQKKKLHLAVNESVTMSLYENSFIWSFNEYLSLVHCASEFYGYEWRCYYCWRFDVESKCFRGLIFKLLGQSKLALRKDKWSINSRPVLLWDGNEPLKTCYFRILCYSRLNFTSFDWISNQ